MAADYSHIREDIFNVKERADFERVALEIFRMQSKECIPYKEYISILNLKPDSLNRVESIPFLPVRYFKSMDVICGDTRSVNSNESDTLKIFTSSATTGMVPARHLVKDISIYEESFLRSFTLFFGPPQRYTILALLPSYLEREGSSLVYMAERLITMTGKSRSGFYLYNFEELHDTLLELKERNEPTILLGVSFALLDFVEKYKIDFPALTVMETGGMKGRGTEISRNRLHALLANGFGVEKIASEYGMAELLSQAYSYGDGVFQTPPWMQILIRDLNNPFKIGVNKTGGINIVDLANINSCSFIETEDMGTKKSENMFTISGRILNSERRGCNMLVES